MAPRMGRATADVPLFGYLVFWMTGLFHPNSSEIYIYIYVLRSIFWHDSYCLFRLWGLFIWYHRRYIFLLINHFLGEVLSSKFEESQTKRGAPVS